MEAIFSVCGAGGPQLKRNPLGRTMTSHTIRAICCASGLLLLASSRATAQRRCDQGPLPDTASVDAVFLALLTATERTREVVSIDNVRSSWPLVRFHFRPYHGWKLDPRSVPYHWDPDTSGVLIASVGPEDDSGIPDHSWVLVYMKVGYPTEIVMGDPVPRPLKDEGVLQLVACGLKASPDTSLGTRLYGPAQWRSEARE